jgi:hypothetical protein
MMMMMIIIIIVIIIIAGDVVNDRSWCTVSDLVRHTKAGHR